MKDYGVRRNYLVTYKAVDHTNAVVKEGTIRAKNKLSEFDALAGTENYLKAKYPEIAKMFGTARLEYIDIFGDLFKNKWP